jgi:soluble lytic murein transglycosylase-like protein
MKMCKHKALVIILFIVSIAASAQAQTAAASGSGSLSSQSQGQVAAATTPLKEGSTTAAEQYQSSLKTLAASYDEGLKRLADQNTKIKELFDKGLVSRRDVEQSDSAVAEARAKVENVQKEMAAAKAEALRASAEVAMITKQNSGLAWSTGNQQIDALIRYNGERYGIDPYLIYCVIHQESGFHPTAVSGKGAQGLMQLMPATAARYGVTNAYDPAQSIKGGTRYLRDLLDMFDGKVDLTLAAYNAGEGAVMKYGNRVPPYQETRDYVRNIIARYNSSGLRQSALKAAL